MLPWSLAAITVLACGMTGSGAEAQAPLAQDLLVGTSVTGTLDGAGTTNVYRFRVAALERIAVTVQPPPDGAVAVSVMDAAGQPMAVVADPSVGVPWVWVGQLSPGEYEVAVRSATGRGHGYRVGLDRLDPFAVSQDQEPNDTPDRARPVPTFLSISGTQDADGDVDWYRIEPLLLPTTMTLVATGALDPVRVSDGETDLPTVADPATGRIWTALLPAGVPLYLVVTPTGAYDIHIEGGVPDPSGPPVPARQLEAETSMTATPSRVAADWPTTQRLPAVLTLINEERDARQVTLDALTSDEAWTVDIERTSLVLDGAAILYVPVVIVVPPGAPADIPVRTTIRARGTDGSQATGFVDVTPTRDAPPVTR